MSWTVEDKRTLQVACVAPSAILALGSGYALSALAFALVVALALCDSRLKRKKWLNIAVVSFEQIFAESDVISFIFISLLIKRKRLMQNQLTK